MKVTILYFSGTGNTDYVARYLARKLEGAAVEVELRSVEQQPAETVTGFDVLAIGFPVHMCDSPAFCQRCLAELPPADGRGAYVFCTKGLVAGSAVRRNLSRLANQGYVPLGGASVGMPGSDGLPFVTEGSRLARAALEKDYDHLEGVDRLAERMLGVQSAVAGGEPIETFRHPTLMGVSGTLFDRLWALVYQAFGDYLRGRFWADERCSECKLCARLCPVGSIEVNDGRPRFGDGCELCMRCIHACPEEAIQIGRATIDKFRWHGPTGDFHPLLLRPAFSVGEDQQ